jgi:hypothetical protein
MSRRCVVAIYLTGYYYYLYARWLAAARWAPMAATYNGVDVAV